MLRGSKRLQLEKEGEESVASLCRIRLPAFFTLPAAPYIRGGFLHCSSPGIITYAAGGALLKARAHAHRDNFVQRIRLRSEGHPGNPLLDEIPGLSAP